MMRIGSVTERRAPLEKQELVGGAVVEVLYGFSWKGAIVLHQSHIDDDDDVNEEEEESFWVRLLGIGVGEYLKLKDVKVPTSLMRRPEPVLVQAQEEKMDGIGGDYAGRRRVAKRTMPWDRDHDCFPSPLKKSKPKADDDQCEYESTEIHEEEPEPLMSVADDECEIEIEENPWEPLMSMADDYEEDPSEDETQSSMGSCPSTGLILNVTQYHGDTDETSDAGSCCGPYQYEEEEDPY
uniref:Uncharacterized protein n=1 Tax=Fagus sylvatica TaxID=28930 RepID=A0A2N9HIU9_FAGSY